MKNGFWCDLGKKCMILMMSLTVFLVTVTTVPFEETATILAADQKTVHMNTAAQSVVLHKSVKLKLVNAPAGKVKWSSSKPKVAKVSSTGKVTGLKKGTAVIKAKYKGKTYKCTVTVETPSLSQTDIWMTVASDYSLTVKGTKGRVQWSSSNSSVASVENGVVTAHSLGTAQIYAKVGGKKYTCKVNVVSMQEAYAHQLVDLINFERSKYGVPPLNSNKYLKKAATIRAEELSRYYSSTRPNKYSCFSAIPKEYKWRKASELTARKYITPEQVVRAWAEDPDQLAILLKKNYKDIGVGVYLAPDGYLYWCVFEARK